MISPCGIDNQSTCANVIRLRDDPLSRHARRPEKRGKPRYPGSEATRNVANPDSLAVRQRETWQTPIAWQPSRTKTAPAPMDALSKLPAKQDGFLTSVCNPPPGKRFFLPQVVPLCQANGFSYGKSIAWQPPPTSAEKCRESPRSVYLRKRCAPNRRLSHSCVNASNKTPATVRKPVSLAMRVALL